MIVYHGTSLSSAVNIHDNGIDLSKSNLNYRKFDSEDTEWAKFIMANRVTNEIAEKLGLQESNRDFRYDVIIGGAADGNVANIASTLRYGKQNLADFQLKLADFFKEDGKSYGTQIAFCTEKSLSCIKYIRCDILNLGMR